MSKNGEGENLETTLFESAHTHACFRPLAAGFETENQGNCAGGRKSAWTRRQRRAPELIASWGLRLNKKG